MMSNSKTSWAATLATAMLCATISASAQEIPQERQVMTITAGTVFEILGVGDARDTQFSWVLTKNREFIEAARGPIFRIRLAQPGAYLLEGGAFTPEKSAKRTSVAITIEPAKRTETGTGSSLSPEDSASTQLVATDPPLIRDAILTGPEADIVRLLPVRKNVQLNLDIDNARDTDNDGNAQNDIDNPTTFFKTDGTPLALWFASDREKRIITIHAESGTGSVQSQEITIFTDPDGIARQGVVSEEKGPGRVQLRVQFRGNEPPEAPLFFRWDFGDDEASVAESPVHAYAASGSYTVRVEVIDLETAKAVFAGTKIVSVSEGAMDSGGGIILSSSASSAAASESPEEPSASGGGSLLWTITKGLLWLLLSAGVGFAVMFVLGKIRRSGGLQKGLANMEGKLTKNNAPVSLPDSAPPMELKRAEKMEEPAPSPAPKSAKKEEPKSMPPPPNIPSPIPSPSPVVTPPWLQKGLDTSMKNTEPRVVPPETPKPAIQFQKPPMPQTPAVSQAPAAPKEVFTPPSTPAPATLEPRKPSAPVKSEAPKIATPKAEPIPASKPTSKDLSKPLPSPNPNPSPSPNPNPIPPPPALPELPSAPPTPNPNLNPSSSNPDDTDPTVAIIQADSLQ